MYDHIFLQFIGILIGIIFFQTSINQDGVRNIYGVLFFLVTSTTFTNIVAVAFVSIGDTKLCNIL